MGSSVLNPSRLAQSSGSKSTGFTRPDTVDRIQFTRSWHTDRPDSGKRVSSPGMGVQFFFCDFCNRAPNTNHPQIWLKNASRHPPTPNRTTWGQAASSAPRTSCVRERASPLLTFFALRTQLHAREHHHNSTYDVYGCMYVCMLSK